MVLFCTRLAQWLTRKQLAQLNHAICVTKNTSKRIRTYVAPALPSCISTRTSQRRQPKACGESLGWVIAKNIFILRHIDFDFVYVFEIDVAF